MKEKAPLTPQQAVRRFKIVCAIIGAMILLVIVGKITSSQRQADENAKSPLETRMDAQLDSLLALHYPQGTIILQTGQIDTMVDPHKDDSRHRNTIRRYKRAVESGTYDSERLAQLKEESLLAESILSIPRPVNYQRNALIELPDGKQIFIYQKMNGDKSCSQIIMTAAKAASEEENKPDFDN